MGDRRPSCQPRLTRRSEVGQAQVPGGQDFRCRAADRVARRSSLMHQERVAARSSRAESGDATQFAGRPKPHPERTAA